MADKRNFEHGTMQMYNKGCRCKMCKKAQRENYMAKVLAKKINKILSKP